MPRDVEFEVNSKFSEEFIMHRLAQIVRGRANRHFDENFNEKKEEAQRDSDVPWKKENDSWQLDHGNDWFGLRLEAGGGILKKKARYRLSHRYDAPVEGLKEFLEYIFD